MVGDVIYLCSEHLAAFRIVRGGEHFVPTPELLARIDDCPDCNETPPLRKGQKVN